MARTTPTRDGKTDSVGLSGRRHGRLLQENSDRGNTFKREAGSGTAGPRASAFSGAPGRRRDSGREGGPGQSLTFISRSGIIVSISSPIAPPLCWSKQPPLPPAALPSQPRPLRGQLPSLTARCAPQTPHFRRALVTSPVHGTSEETEDLPKSRALLPAASYWPTRRAWPQGRRACALKAPRSRPRRRECSGLCL